MQRIETGLDFPDVHGYVMHTHIETCQPNFLLLWFHKHTVDASELIDVNILLAEACLEFVNVEITPFLPAVKSYSIEGLEVTNRTKKRLNIDFESGAMSISFAAAVYVKSFKPLGKLPEEIKTRLGLQ